jgi:hypothetical protein
LGKRIKVLEVGEVIKADAKGVKLGKGTGIAVPHIFYGDMDGKNCRLM